LPINTSIRWLSGIKFLENDNKTTYIVNKLDINMDISVLCSFTDGTQLQSNKIKVSSSVPNIKLTGKNKIGSTLSIEISGINETDNKQISFYIDKTVVSSDETYKIVKELITKKSLKQAQADHKDKNMLKKAAYKINSLTGAVPGEISGVVLNEKSAEKKIAENMKKIKIAAAMVLAYGDNEEQKKSVMLDIESKYPELAKEIRQLAKKAKERVNTDTFKQATVGAKFGGDTPKKANAFTINEYGEIIRGGR
jgi:2'-5' RNA ligase